MELNPEEKQFAKMILQQLSEGDSTLYQDLLYGDYDEVPVDISTFLHNKYYLGGALTDDEGRFTLYPYWEELLKEIFYDPLKPAKYNTLALSGAIGLGKSTEAVIIGIYELYRMLCLKDPYVHYGLMPTDLITFAVMNITLDAAKGVAWDKLQSMIQASPWFMARGSVTKGDVPQWKPPKGIELIFGSQSRHIIGRAVYWCLDGDSIVSTENGDKRIIDLVDQQIRVKTVNDKGEIVLSDICTVKPTAIETEEYQIELEDGTIIKCTPTHRFMLMDGTYKEAQYLTEKDELADF